MATRLVSLVKPEGKVPRSLFTSSQLSTQCTGHPTPTAKRCGFRVGGGEGGVGSCRELGEASPIAFQRTRRLC